MTTTTGGTGGELCPPGGYVCDLTVKNNLVDVAGKKTEYVVGNCATAGSVVKETNYAFTAPVTVGNDVICELYQQSDPNKDTAGAGVSLCPGGF